MVRESERCCKLFYRFSGRQWRREWRIGIFFFWMTRLGHSDSIADPHWSKTFCLISYAIASFEHHGWAQTKNNRWRSVEISLSKSSNEIMPPIRLRHPKGVSTIEVPFDSSDFTVKDLQQEIYTETQIIPSRQIRPFFSIWIDIADQLHPSNL